jgi:HD-GYP domain-containing protein (c-di-GMP phosphodiesterase class II)
MDADREVLETLQEKVILEGPEMSVDGHLVWLQRIKKPLMSPDGCTWHILGVTSDITAIKENEIRLQASQTELEMQLKRLDHAWRQTITALSSTSETKDPYTAGHQRRVAELAVAIGTELGFGEDEVISLSLAGAVHDIGKIVVPGEILSKPSRLTPTERKLIETHSHAGHDILKDLDLPWPIADIVHQHHERMDGSGYPLGLKSGEICVEARIIAVADVVESMMSHRPYRKALGQDAALAEIEAGREKLYDSVVVDACLELFRHKRFSFQ